MSHHLKKLTCKGLCGRCLSKFTDWGLGYNEFDLFKENEENGPCEGCKIEIEDTFTEYVFVLI
jgi:hypothetical protein